MLKAMMEKQKGGRRLGKYLGLRDDDDEDEDEEEDAKRSKKSPASKFFTLQLRFYSAMLISYKVVEAARLARVFAHDPPTSPALIAEFKKHGINPDQWEGWMKEYEEPHNVIIGLQMTGGEGLDKAIKHMPNEAGESLLYAVAS